MWGGKAFECLGEGGEVSHDFEEELGGRSKKIGIPLGDYFEYKLKTALKLVPMSVVDVGNNDGDKF